MRLSGLERKELVGMKDGKKYGLLQHAELVLEPRDVIFYSVEHHSSHWG